MPDNKPIDHNENPIEPWVSDDDWVADLNIRWRAVIEGLMNRKLIYEAYADAYDMDLRSAKQRNVARAAGSRLLTNVNFKALWRKVLEERGFNDETVDFELMNMITDKKLDPRSKNMAIKHYNELRGRVIKKQDITSNGESIAPKIISDVKPRVSVKAETADSN